MSERGVTRGLTGLHLRPKTSQLLFKEEKGSDLWQYNCNELNPENSNSYD